MKQSLEHRLSVWLSVAIVLTALIAGVLSFASAFDEAIELQDEQLRQVASLISAQRISVEQPSLQFGQKTKLGSRLIFQSLDRRSDPGSGERPRFSFPPDLPDGIQTTSVHGRNWRVFVCTSRSGERIAIGQMTEIRNDVARESSLLTLIPLIVLIPVLVILARGIVRRMFRPLARLSACVDARDQNDLNPLADNHVPDEIRPFVTSINGLLARVSLSVEEQHRFVADAAHELRSPITALCLQAENLGHVELSSDAGARLATLRQGLDRARSLIEQLLALARSRSKQTPSDQNVSLQSLVRHVMEELMPLAQAKSLDLGVDRDEPAMVRGCELDIMTVLRNLIDNAIRYAPSGGRIDVRIYSSESGFCVIEVEDSGPGISEEERSRVFQPFYRILGSAEEGAGLGLSIVKNIVSRLNGSIRLEAIPGKRLGGLCVVVEFPSV